MNINYVNLTYLKYLAVRLGVNDKEHTWLLLAWQKETKEEEMWEVKISWQQSK